MHKRRNSNSLQFDFREQFSYELNNYINSLIVFEYSYLLSFSHCTIINYQKVVKPSLSYDREHVPPYYYELNPISYYCVNIFVTCLVEIKRASENFEFLCRNCKVQEKFYSTHPSFHSGPCWMWHICEPNWNIIKCIHILDRL